MALNRYAKYLEFLSVIFSLLCFVFMIIVYLDCNSINTSYFATLSKNWNTGVVINNSNNDIECFPHGPFISFYWPGTVTGCFATSFYRGRCGSSTRNYVRGTEYNALPPKPYKFWRGNLLCSSRVNATYLDLTIAESSNSCPLEYRSCGKIDTLGNFMCVPTSTPCPINYFKFVTNGQPLPSGFNYTKIDLVGASFISSNFNTNGDLLVELELSEDQPCVDPDYKNYLSPPFILETFYGNDKCINPIFGSVFDPYFKELDEYSFFKVYQENNINTFLNAIPTYDSYSISLQSSKRTLKLYGRNYIGIKVSCINMIKQTPGMAKNIIQDLELIHSAFKGSKLISLFGFIFGAIGFSSILLILILRMIFCPDIKLKKKFWVSLSAHIFILAVFLISCVCVNNFTGISTAFKYLADNNCSDPILKNMINDAVKNSFSTFLFSILSLIFSLLDMIGYSVTLLIYHLDRDSD